MARVARNPPQASRRFARHKKRIAGRVASQLSVTVCGFEFEFANEDQLRTYIEWFENFAKLHRRQFKIINAVPPWRNAIAKLPAHLFKTQNRPKVITALRSGLDEDAIGQALSLQGSAATVPRKTRSGRRSHRVSPRAGGEVHARDRGRDDAHVRRETVLIKSFFGYHSPGQPSDAR